MCICMCMCMCMCVYIYIYMRVCVYTYIYIYIYTYIHSLYYTCYIYATYVYIMHTIHRSAAAARRAEAVGHRRRGPHGALHSAKGGVHAVLITRLSLTRFVPRVGLPRNLFVIGSLTAALRFSKGGVRTDLNLVMGIGCSGNQV